MNWKEIEDLKYMLQEHGLCEVLRNVALLVEESVQHEDYDKLDALYNAIESARGVC